ncbi:hypothetical protein AXG93_4170s1070 [Marchantia polymorpha subsp. ruderalis]|uniref:Uncharacterized protein n=1 Tax=Marchantia polymorpha subsp. ruderalis TaxID=1480154 RepID=A0A176VPC2_MARPO|nr:hypothetical protein AXG93_4170s1070 [Marchantia polymorpha subsp. ruderalis]
MREGSGGLFLRGKGKKGSGGPDKRRRVGLRIGSRGACHIATATVPLEFPTMLVAAAARPRRRAYTVRRRRKGSHTLGDRIRARVDAKDKPRRMSEQEKGLRSGSVRRERDSQKSVAAPPSPRRGGRGLGKVQGAEKRRPERSARGRRKRERGGEGQGGGKARGREGKGRGLGLGVGEEKEEEQQQERAEIHERTIGRDVRDMAAPRLGDRVALRVTEGIGGRRVGGVGVVVVVVSVWPVALLALLACVG